MGPGLIAFLSCIDYDLIGLLNEHTPGLRDKTVEVHNLWTITTIITRRPSLAHATRDSILE